MNTSIHADTNNHIHKSTNKNMCIQLHTYTQTHKHTQTHPHKQAHTQTLLSIFTLCTHTCVQPYPYAHPHSHTHTCTNQCLSLSLSLSNAQKDRKNKREKSFENQKRKIIISRLFSFISSPLISTECTILWPPRLSVKQSFLKNWDFFPDPPLSTCFPAAGLSTSHVSADWLLDWSLAAKWA